VLDITDRAPKDGEPANLAREGDEWPFVMWTDEKEKISVILSITGIKNLKYKWKAWFTGVEGKDEYNLMGMYEERKDKIGSPPRLALDQIDGDNSIWWYQDKNNSNEFYWVVGKYDRMNPNEGRMMAIDPDIEKYLPKEPEKKNSKSEEEKKKPEKKKKKNKKANRKTVKNQQTHTS